jgi:acyl carrier protein
MTLTDNANLTETSVIEGPAVANALHRDGLSLREWLIGNIASVLEIDAATIDVNRNLDELGLDSLQAVCLAGDLEAWLGVEVPETALWDYPTIESMCEYVTRKIPAARQLTY